MTPDRVRSITKLAAIVVAAGLLGIGIGWALTSIGGDDSSDPLDVALDTATSDATTTVAVRSTSTVPATKTTSKAGSTRPRGSTATTTPGTTTTTTPAGTTAGTPSRTSTTPPSTTTTTRTPSKRAAGIRLQVFSAVVHPAGTPSGRRRSRARLSVHVRVTNRRTIALNALKPAVISGRLRIAGAPRVGSGRTLLVPIAIGARGQGRIRFETAGPVTRGMLSTHRVRIRVAGVAMTVPLTIGRPVSHKAPAG